MRNVLSKKLKNRKGFTLAELLIVVAIIAVLVAIMMPVFGKSRADAIQAKDAANIRSEIAKQVVEEMSDVSYAGGVIQVTISKADFDIKSGITGAGSSDDAGTDIVVTYTGSSGGTTIYVDELVKVTIND